MASKEMITFLNQLDDNQIIEFSKRDDFKKALNVNPPKTWVKTNKYANNSEYIPIDKVEALLDCIFQEWQVEIKEVKQLAQSICAIVRLHYKDPINNEWRYHDGVGATPIKTEKDADASDMSKIISSAIATGAPSAVSYAIKDAADHLGNLFGKNLNRKDTIDGSMSIYSATDKNIAEGDVSKMQYTLATEMAKKDGINIVDAIAKVRQLTLEELQKKFVKED